jgi:hypothetical protein
VPVTSGLRGRLYRLRPGPGEPGQPLERFYPLRIPPSRFSVALGLAGLATAWHAAQPVLGTPPAVPDAINALAAVVLLVLGGLYALQGPRQVLADLRDPVQGPFVPVSALTRLDELIVPLVTARAPGLLSLFGVGPDTAAMLLIAAGDHPDRLRSDAARAHRRAAAPNPASPGKVARHRLNRGGDRQANHAPWRIVTTLMGSHPPTRAYVTRRSNEGLSKPEIIRRLSYAARETHRHLRPT